MNSPPGFDRRGFEKQIHQQRLAAPDGPENIDAARRIGGPHADQTLQGVERATRTVPVKTRRKRLQPFDDGDLRRVRLKATRGDKFAIALADGKPHCPEKSLLMAQNPARSPLSRDPGAGELDIFVAILIMSVNHKTVCFPLGRRARGRMARSLPVSGLQAGRLSLDVSYHPCGPCVRNLSIRMY